MKWNYKEEIKTLYDDDIKICHVSQRIPVNGAIFTIVHIGHRDGVMILEMKDNLEVLPDEKK